MPTAPWRHYSEPDPNKEYLALLTYLSLKRYRTMPRFFVYTNRIQTQLEKTAGIVCFALKAHILARDFWTLSVWKHETHMRRFAFEGFHRGVMLVLKEDISNFKNIPWVIQGSELPPSWPDALERHRQVLA